MSEDEKIRVLICHTCGSLEEIPYYRGPVENDTLLEYRVQDHRFPDGNAHFGDLAVVASADWKNKAVRAEIMRKLNDAKAPGEAEGLGSAFYGLKNTFQDDAMRCWKQHNRTSNCGDYRKESKRLVADTKAERKDLGLSVKDRPNTWLCDFCPFQTIVDRKSKGN